MKTTLPALPNLSLIRVYLIFFCIFIYSSTIAQTPKTGKGYMNITKGNAGGTFEAGDTLQIRATLSLSENGNFGYIRFVDTIPANTTYVTGSMKLITNEGIPYRSYTDASDADGGIYNSVNKTLKLHCGGVASAGGAASTTDPASYSTAPWIDKTSKPSFFKNTCIIVASYKITIDAVPVNTVITAPGGKFYYSITGGTVPTSSALPAFIMKVAPNLGLCTNKVASNFVLESNGTFGTGNAKNRTASLSIATSYDFKTLGNSNPNDGEYAIVNNTSSGNSTNPNLGYGTNATSNTRVFNLWEITGDHTSSSNPTNGNNPVASGTNGGYMLVVNASYVNGRAVSQTISNLCDETYYEFSAWFKNICKYCGCDINGEGAFSTSYNTATPGDSSGVKPNLTFEVDGESLYTSGDLKFTGKWIKKGFIFKTKPGQTSITISVRNNSSGGGGNDWTMDDLSLSICGPGISVTPTRITDCNNNYINMAATVKYFQQNYGSYVWEKSTNGGSTWATTATSGTVTPQLVSGQYEYTVQYPSFLTTTADDGDRYRLRVASNTGNLSTTSCSYIDTTVASLTIFDCQVLPVNFLSFNGSTANLKNTLRWSTQREVNPSTYTLERSLDGDVYTTVATLNSLNQEGTNNYKYTDPLASGKKTWYRILIKDLTTEKTKYTNIVVLNGVASERPSTINVLENPFSDVINIEIAAGQEEDVVVGLYDIYGRVIRSGKYSVENGYRKISLENLGSYTSGFYLLKVGMGNQSVTKKLIKQ